MSEIVRLSDSTRIVQTSVGAFAVSTGCSTSNWDFNETRIGWEKEPLNVLGKEIVPYGENNDLPVVIRNIMDANNLAPGILEREIGLLYGDGPRLYRVEFQEGQVVRSYIEDKEVWAWLQSWDFRRFVDMAMTEYKYLKGFFVRRYLNRGPRVARAAKVAKLDVIPATDARLEFARSRRLEDVKHIYVGDFENNCIYTGITTYPVYNADDPFRHGVCMSYHNSYSFARNFYSVPSYYGTLKWIMRSSDIPEIIKYLTDNGISVAYHVHSPSEYWEQKKEILEEKYPSASVAEISKKLDELKDETFRMMGEVLAGKKNVGKFIDTVDFYDNEGNLCSWKIEPIDQKVKDFIDAQLKIAEKADSATTSGLGLHPSLSNIIVGGQLSSGSQMLYALKLYLASDTTIPEEVVFEPVNQAIRDNFPGKDVRIGFYHRIVMAEDGVNPEARVKENI